MAKAKKKAAKKSSLHKEVHHMWGWVVLAAGILMILSVAGYYYVNMINY